MTISIASIACIIISALLSTGVPIALLIFVRKKYGAPIIPALVGALAFVLFALVLEQQMHMLVLKPAADGTIALRSQPFLYMLYGCFAAGIFEETARFISFHILKRRFQGIKTAVSYGIGHGGTEAILIAGLAMINNAVFAFMVNSNGIESFTAGENGALIAQQIQALAATPPSMFLVSALERMSALAIQIGLSVIVFYSVYPKRRLWLFPLAILIHAVIDAPAALMQAGALTSLFFVEALVFVLAVATVGIAVYTHRKSKQEIGAG